MELLATDLKRRGQYLARTLSFAQCEYEVKYAELSSQFIELHSASAKIWTDLRRVYAKAIALTNCSEQRKNVLWSGFWGAFQRFFKALCVTCKLDALVGEAKAALAMGRCVVIGIQTTGEAVLSRVLEGLGGKNPSGFISDMEATLVETIRNLPLQAEDGDEKEGEGEKDDDDGMDGGGGEEEGDAELEHEMEDNDAAEEGASLLLRKSTSSKTSGDSGDSCNSDDSSGSEAIGLSDLSEIQASLVKRARALHLPPSLLDALIDRLGGSSKVAELTGRKLRVVRRGGAAFRVEKRGDGELKAKELNMKEKESFMNGKKMVAIISDAASTGISLHADVRALNQARRVHITPELPWSADKAIQQFGRSHRSNQVSGPYYVLLQSPIAGEARFASAVAARMAMLGAISKGDHRAAAGQDMSDFAIEGTYGHAGLNKTYSIIEGFKETNKALVGHKFFTSNSKMGNPARRAEFIRACQEGFTAAGMGGFARSDSGCVAAHDAASPSSSPAASFSVTPVLRFAFNYPRGDVTRFLNRLLAFPLSVQKDLFDLFMTCVDIEIKDAKAAGKFKGGNCDLPGTAEVTETEDLLDLDAVVFPPLGPLTPTLTPTPTPAPSGGEEKAAATLAETKKDELMRPTFEKSPSGTSTSTSSTSSTSISAGAAAGVSSDRENVLQLKTLSVDRGMSWAACLEKVREVGAELVEEARAKGKAKPIDKMQFFVRKSAANGEIQPCLALVPRHRPKNRDINIKGLPCAQTLAPGIPAQHSPSNAHLSSPSSIFHTILVSSVEAERADVETNVPQLHRLVRRGRQRRRRLCGPLELVVRPLRHAMRAL